MNSEKTKSDVINESIINEIFSNGNSLDKNAELLGWLVANNYLEIRLSIMHDSNNRLIGSEELSNTSLFHHKTGIFSDECGNCISFNGSINETMSAWIRNSESFDVFCSWKPGQEEYIGDHKEKFNRYWEIGKYNRVETISFPDAVKEMWIQNVPDSIEDLIAYKEYIKSSTKNLETTIEDRPYQREAVEKWVSQEYCGLFDMATGTGKTKTAMLAIKKLLNDTNETTAVVIVCPYLHLTQMWEEELELFGFKNYISGHSQSPNWKSTFERKIRLFKREPRSFFFITTINTFCTDNVQKWIDKIADNTLLIVDEVHRMGSVSYSKFLNKNIKYRLGVSATIDRFKDPSGTRKIIDYFGERCITYTLEQAIKDDRLCQYKYHPIVCYFSPSEYHTIIDINEQIEKLLESSSNDLKMIEELRVNGSKLIAKMDDKIEKLIQLVMKHQKEYNMLIYCGSSSVASTEFEIDGETGYSDGSERLITHLSQLLHNKLDLDLRTFTCADSLKERKIIIEDFKKKYIQCILAIRCLDEGVNIPDIKYAFLLSSSDDPKEYIQRRGRVLRKSPSKNHAEIYDFIAFPKSFETNTCSNVNKKIEFGIILKELKRIHEFSRLSLNPQEGNDIIERVSSIYKEFDVWGNLTD